jgi:outer membrane protein OmpA-like peptidoglycan-associated protein
MRVLIVLFAIALTARCYAQERNYYIVVGAFAQSKESYARRFAEKVGDGFLVADPQRHLLLVCLKEYHEKPPSIKEMLATRKVGRFPEAWVRILRAEETQREDVGKSEARIEAAPPESKEPVKQSEPGIRSEPVVVVIPEEQKAVAKQDEDKRVEKRNTEEKTSSENTIPTILFHLYDANNNNKEVEGTIEIVDTQRGRLIGEHKSTDTVAMPNPNSDSGMISFITDVFGYRKVQHEININQPIQDSTKHVFNREGNYYVARFEMVRYHKGDIATLYNVYFYNDAAIMMPESKYELNQLLGMMKSNPNYRILLHGHTNGNGRGQIISMGPSKDFFSLKAPDIKQGSGSSKQLSGQRAEVIKEWLVSQGIAADRMEVKAWGGKRMIHDKNSHNARRNVRVEVEVLAD